MTGSESFPSMHAGQLPGMDDRALVVGIKPWKRWQIDRFLRPRHASLRYCATPAQALRRQKQEGGAIVVWASREPAGFDEVARAQGARVVRIEDGFVRSVGLGSNHVGGASLVIDELGIYFDPRRPSALEQMLETGEFEPPLLERAAALRRLLVESRITKYNVGSQAPAPLGGAPGQVRLLVPGQVEDDASVRLGAPRVRTNVALLRAVRAAHPTAWIVYKPHPDTEAGTRTGAIPDAAATALADEVIRGVSVTGLLPQVDEVHTMTSLVGFEALLRGVPVTTWGQPFYSGWGLTTDRLFNPRRTRRRTLDELVAAALIRYPIYVDPLTHRACEVEHLVARLVELGREPGRADPSVLRRTARLCLGWLRSQWSGGT
jgi:capsular polysaccharide export protein